MSEYGAKVHLDAGGGTLTVESGGVINIESGGDLQFAGVKANMDATEINLLDGCTAGSITASKAVTRTAAQGVPMATLVVAATGSSQGTGAALTKDINLVTGADNTTAVVLPATVVGECITIVNTVSNKTLPVFPATSGNINGLGANAAFTMGPARAATFVCTASNVWYVEAIAAATATAAELNYVSGLTAGTQAASKAVVPDSNVNMGIAKVTQLHIGTSGSETQVNATGAELNLINTVTAGSITASKAVTRTAAQGIPLATLVVAATGANASNGAALTKDVNLVTGADNTTCVVLPVGVAGECITIVNTVADKVLPVFPNGSEAINGGGAGVVFTMGPARAATFVCTAANTWYVDAIAAATATAAQLNFVSGVTAGTQAASKAIVNDTNVNQGVAKVTELHIGASGTETQVTATGAELNLLDTAAAGTVVASIAAIYDSAGKLYRSSATPAAAGADLAGATQLTAEFNAVTGADDAVGVKLPVAAADEVVTVVNTVANKVLLVYPQSGAQINALGASNPFSLTAGQTATFIGRSGTLWYTAAATDTITGLTASAAELNLLDTAEAGTQKASIAVIADANVNIGTTKVTELHIGTSGSETQVTATGAELNALDGAPMGAVITVGTVTANAVECNIQLNDGAGAALAERGHVMVYLSDDANGDSICATAPNGGVVAGTDGLLIPVVADKAFLAVSESDGDLDVVATDSGDPSYYLIVALPNGKLVASAVLDFAT